MENVLDAALNKMLQETSIASRNNTIEEIKRYVENDCVIYNDAIEVRKHIIKKLDDMKELHEIFNYCR